MTTARTILVRSYAIYGYFFAYISLSLCVYLYIRPDLAKYLSLPLSVSLSLSVCLTVSLYSWS